MHKFVEIYPDRVAAAAAGVVVVVVATVAINWKTLELRSPEMNETICLQYTIALHVLRDVRRYTSMGEGEEEEDDDGVAGRRQAYQLCRPAKYQNS